MKEKKLKVLVLFNEANPDYYQKPVEPVPEPDFKPYFEVENLTLWKSLKLLQKSLKEWVLMPTP